MAIFLTGLTESYAGSLPAVNGSYSSEVNGNMDAFMESFDDSLAIIEAMHAMDMVEISGKRKIASLMESGADSDEIEDAEDEMEKAMEASVKEIWGKIVDKIKALWAKIKEFFKSVLRFFDGLFLSADKFLEKYEDQLNQLKNNGKLKNFKAAIHTYTLEKVSYVVNGNIAAKATVEAINAMATDGKVGMRNLSTGSTAEDSDDAYEKEMDNFRAKIVNKSGSVDASEFQEELYGLFRNGAIPSQKPVEDTVDIGKIIRAIKDTAKLKDNVSKLSSDTDKHFAQVLTALNKFEKQQTKFAEDNKSEIESVNAGNAVAIRRTNYNIKLFTAQRSVVNMGINAYKSAITEALNAYKSVCISAFRYKEKSN